MKNYLLIAIGLLCVGVIAYSQYDDRHFMAQYQERCDREGC